MQRKKRSEKACAEQAGRLQDEIELLEVDGIDAFHPPHAFTTGRENLFLIRVWRLLYKKMPRQVLNPVWHCSNPDQGGP